MLVKTAREVTVSHSLLIFSILLHPEVFPRRMTFALPISNYYTWPVPFSEYATVLFP